MDKNNKKEQTFSDLFSNISNESEKDNNQINFNSINNKNSEDKEKITLENLFNKSQKLDPEENNIEDNKSKNNSIKFQGFKFNPEVDNSSTKNTFEKSNTNSENNNSNQKGEKNNDSKNENTTLQNIFENENTNLDNKTISKDKNESKLTEVSQNNIPQENDNFTPNIFDNNNINENKKTNLEIFTKEESHQDNNPILKSNNDSIFDNNIKNTDNSQKENNDTLSENNTFFNNKTTESLENDNLSKKESNLAEEDFISENPFFTEEDNEVKKLEPEEIDINKENFINENPFFTEEKDNEIKKTESEKTDTNKETFTSESPFFTEEKQDNINPFFDNKLNLVENKNYNTNDNLSDKIDTSNVKHFNVKIVNKKEPLIKFILGVLSYAVFIWLLLIGITLLIYVADIKIRAAKGDYSSPTFNAYVVLTGSMLPDIQVYDVVVTKKVDAKDLKEGDIITFASSDTRFLNTIITHRIIKKYYDSETKTYTFQTKGDNNNVADSALVQANNIYGKVILKLPKLGYLQEFLASDGGWIIVILIPCLIVISYDIVKLIKGLKRKKYKNIKVQK